MAALNPIPDLLDALHDGLLGVTDGQVATYIPELAHADPGWFGVALATLDGHVYASGDAARPFTLQSVSKPFVYALALADQGLDEVVTKIGVEPSGDGNGRGLLPQAHQQFSTLDAALRWCEDRLL